MMATTSYITGVEFLERFDARVVGDLVRDDGQQEPADQLPENENLLAAIHDAYGEIVVAIVVGGRYTLDQLEPENLADVSLSFLRRLNGDLAWLKIKQRRGRFDEKEDGKLEEKTSETIKQLQDGVRMLLAVDDDRAKASVLGVAQPEMIPIERRGTIRFKTQNYYPIHPYDQDNRRFSRGGN